MNTQFLRLTERAADGRRIFRFTMEDDDAYVGRLYVDKRNALCRELPVVFDTTIHGKWMGSDQWGPRGLKRFFRAYPHLIDALFNGGKVKA